MDVCTCGEPDARAVPIDFGEGDILTLNMCAICHRPIRRGSPRWKRSLRRAYHALLFRLQDHIIWPIADRLARR